MQEASVNLPDGRTVPVSELVGLTAIAARRGWNLSTLTTWVSRYDTPAPALLLPRGSLYVLTDWDEWNPPKRP